MSYILEVIETGAADLADITLDFIAKQLERVLASNGSIRDDMAVMMEILRRMEKRVETVEFSINSISSQLTEMHAYNRRTEARVAKLEEKA